MTSFSFRNQGLKVYSVQCRGYARYLSLKSLFNVFSVGNKLFFPFLIKTRRLLTKDVKLYHTKTHSVIPISFLPNRELKAIIVSMILPQKEQPVLGETLASIWIYPTCPMADEQN